MISIKRIQNKLDQAIRLNKQDRKDLEKLTESCKVSTFYLACIYQYGRNEDYNEWVKQVWLNFCNIRPSSNANANDIGNTVWGNTTEWVKTIFLIARDFYNDKYFPRIPEPKSHKFYILATRFYAKASDYLAEDKYISRKQVEDWIEEIFW